MGKRFNNFITASVQHLGTLQIIFGGSVLTLSGVLSGWVAQQTTWAEGFGPLGWALVGVGGAFVSGALLLLVFWLRYLWIIGSASDKWSQNTDGVNPLDAEFHKRRIRLADMASPVEQAIEGKNFFGCDLVGPANLFLESDCEISGVGFNNCNVVVLREGNYYLFNNIKLRRVKILSCRVYNCNLFIPAGLAHHFIGKGLPVVTYTGNDEWDKKLLDEKPLGL